MTTTIHDDQCAPRLLMAIELVDGNGDWRLPPAWARRRAGRSRPLLRRPTTPSPPVNWQGPEREMSHKSTDATVGASGRTAVVVEQPA